MSSDRLRQAYCKLESAVVALGGHPLGTKTAINALVVAAQEEMRERAAQQMESHTSWGGGLNVAWANEIRALKPRTGGES